jgi:hypothetical protein
MAEQLEIERKMFHKAHFKGEPRSFLERIKRPEDWGKPEPRRIANADEIRAFIMSHR